MNYYLPNVPGPRVAVIRKSDRVQVGTMPLSVGMVLDDGSVVLSITKSGTPVVTVPGGTHKQYWKNTSSIFVSEAYGWGYPRFTKGNEP